jgi:hypothetical protein
MAKALLANTVIGLTFAATLSGCGPVSSGNESAKEYTSADSSDIRPLESSLPNYNAPDNSPAYSQDLDEGSQAEAAKRACYDYLYARAWDEGFNFEYHTEHTHGNWKMRYGDNYIHQYIIRRVRNGSAIGDPFFKHCVVSKSSLEVLRVENSDIGA